MASTSINIDTGLLLRVEELAAQKGISNSSVFQTATAFYLDIEEAADTQKVLSAFSLLERKLKLKGWKIEKTMVPPDKEGFPRAPSQEKGVIASIFGGSNE